MITDQCMALVHDLDDIIQVLAALQGVAEAGRQTRAEDVTFTKVSISAAEVEGRCPSSQDPDRLYRVRVNMQSRTWNCTCEDRRSRGSVVGPCKHALALASTVVDRASRTRDALVAAVSLWEEDPLVV